MREHRWGLVSTDDGSPSLVTSVEVREEGVVVELSALCVRTRGGHDLTVRAGRAIRRGFARAELPHGDRIEVWAVHTPRWVEIRPKAGGREAASAVSLELRDVGAPSAPSSHGLVVAAIDAGSGRPRPIETFYPMATCAEASPALAGWLARSSRRLEHVEAVARQMAPPRRSPVREVSSTGPAVVMRWKGEAPAQSSDGALQEDLHWLHSLRMEALAAGHAAQSPSPLEALSALERFVMVAGILLAEEVPHPMRDEGRHLSGRVTAIDRGLEVITERLEASGPSLRSPSVGIAP